MENREETIREDPITEKGITEESPIIEEVVTRGLNIFSLLDIKERRWITVGREECFADGRRGKRNIL